jgi:DNA polymerase I-like protein with 3'-5' exonuclease and polymerase domains
MPTDDADDFLSGFEDDVPSEPAPPPVVTPPPPVVAPPVSASTDEDVDPVTGLVRSSNSDTTEDSGEIILPWMRFHEFHLVETAQELEKIVDKAIAHGSCALDLETEGFDNRIDYDADGKPHTIHQIVGACLSVKGVGYYVPVRHQFNAGYDEPDPNIPIPAFERALSRLCKAAQPELTPEGLEEDPLGSPKIAKKGQVVIKFWNAKFDQEFLYPITGVDYWHPQSFEDGMLIRYCIYTDDLLGLKHHAQKKLRVKDPKTGQEYPYEMIKFSDLFKKETKKADRKIQTLHPHFNKNVTRYGCSDAICTELLVDLSLPELLPLKANFTYLVEKHTAQVVRQMERTRTKIDRAIVAQVLEEAEKELQDLDHKIKELAKSRNFPDFNPASTAQLSEFLFGAKYLDIEPKPQMTEGGQYKTDADTLESMLEENPDAPPVLQWILHFRQIQRIIGTYLNRFLSDSDAQDQLRFNFNQTGAQTGRFTAPAGEPDHGFFGGPIQGIPARDDPKKPKVAGSLRRVFVARPGYTLVKCDYAGQELRVVANVSGEPLWINEFVNGSGDLHTLTARAFFNVPEGTPVTKIQRNAGKTANFALVYGGGVQAVRRATGVDKHEAARQKAAFDKSVPTFTRWLKGQHEAVKKNLGIRTAYQRWIAIPDANLKAGGTFLTSNGKEMPVDVQMAKKIQASCERKAVNFPIQGAGADIMKISLTRLTKELCKKGWLRLRGGDDSVRMLMTVHDEIVFEVRHDRLEEAVPLICETMESPTKDNWKVRLVVEPLIGLDWSAKYDWVKIKSGEKPVPEWLTDYVKPGEAPVHAAKEPSTPKTPAPPPPALVENAPTPERVVKALSGEKDTQVAVFSLSTIHMGAHSTRVVTACCYLAWDDNGKLLRLTDETGNVLINPSIGIRVDPVLFGHELRSRNLGPGRYEIVDE